MRNVIIQFEMGESVLIYAHDELSNDVLKRLGERNVGKVTDVYEVKQEEIQYYCIDGRCWYDTKERANRVLKFMNEPLIS
jgi:hypothetical protein